MAARGIPAQILNIGGGYPITYERPDAPDPLVAIAESVNDA